MHCRFRTALAVCAWLAGATAAAEAPPGFTTYRAYYDQADRPVGHEPLDMNESDQVVGSLWSQPWPQNAFRWTPPHRFERVEGASALGTYAHLQAINDHGLAVGDTTVIDNGVALWRGLALEPDGQRHVLAHEHPMEHMVAVDVNNHGTVLGVAHGGLHGKRHVVLWAPDGTLERLFDIPHDVVAINDDGDIAGHVRTGVSFLRKASGALLRIPMTLHALNDERVAAGRVGTGRRRAAIWSETGGLERLPVPRLATECEARDVNRHLQVVGFCHEMRSGRVPVSRPVIWQKIDGQWQGASLAALLEQGHISLAGSSHALRITDAGHILVYASPTPPPSYKRAMVLVPVRR
ncbi:hypothetical protein [Ideonella sp.]|uniref:hypothetical protein n=1 Tax=Ideonella sp. TaxID=1929293 RepID=UPI0035AD7D39